MKITDYDLVTNLDTNDVFLLDGSRGTKIINQSNVTKEGKLLKITFSNVSSLPVSVSDSRITSDMVVTSFELSSSNAYLNGSLTTSTGSATLSGTISGTTNVTCYLEKCVNA